MKTFHDLLQVNGSMQTSEGQIEEPLDVCLSKKPMDMWVLCGQCMWNATDLLKGKNQQGAHKCCIATFYRLSSTEPDDPMDDEEENEEVGDGDILDSDDDMDHEDIM